MKPLVKVSVWLSLLPPLNDLPPPHLEDSESTDDDLDPLVYNMQQLEFNDPHIEKKVEEITQAIWILGRPDQTRQQANKMK